ncbi:hypothetical protein PRIPAC_91133, partial [Pristionchus pacificus]
MNGRAFKRLQSMIFTEKNIEDIKHVSWILKTSTCESLNALACRYAPKDNFFDRKGHELRAMMTTMHWNELKRDEAEGTRTITGKKYYFNNTLKKNVARNVKSPAKNAWRAIVKAKCYEVRASLTSSPYTIVKNENIEKQKEKDHWNSINTPIVPHWADSNLDQSEDEDELADLP